MRHLVCVPYSVENLHEMARDLGVKGCWYHARPHPHYDMPKRAVAELSERVEMVSPRVIMRIIRDAQLSGD
jgi:FMN phosphatase YigB (HAD superfamily)